MTTWFNRNKSQSDHPLVEPTRRIKVVAIDDGLENRLRRGRALPGQIV